MGTAELYEKFKDFTEEQLDSQYINSCRHNDLDTVKFLLNNMDVDVDVKNGSGFIWACQHGNFEIIKYITSSSELKKHANIYEKNSVGVRVLCSLGDKDIVDYLFNLKQSKDISEEDIIDGFFKACSNGHLELVKYFLTDQKFIELNLLSKESDYGFGFTGACRSGNIELIDFLLNSTELKNNASVYDGIEDDEHDGFIAACRYDRIGVVDYFLNDKELNYIPDRINLEKAFIASCSAQTVVVPSFLIFEMNIEKTENIKKYLKENPKEEIEKMFKLRELNETLHNELKSDKFISKKLKV